MYCIKCGVELADSEKRCPLCGTPVFHPDLPRNLTEPPYPADRRIRREDVNRSGILFVLTVVALLPAILSLLCDWRINGTIVWSGYAAGAIGLLVTAGVVLTRYLHGGWLYIYGGAFILAGGLAVLIEFLINLTFQLHETFFWAFYPLAAGVILGLMLIVIAICKPLRESLQRKFFF